MSLKKKRLTLADVAKASGFSVSTVSIVLNDAPLSRNIAAVTKKKIRETALRLGYQPDVIARSFRSQRSHTIGVLVIDLADPFCTLILQGIERKLLPTAYLPIMMDAHNRLPQMERYLQMMVERRVEGLIVVANWLLFDIKLLEDLSMYQIPTVIVGREFESQTISSVLVNNEAGGYLALEHLYELGHREIAIIRGPKQLVDSQLRWNGIKRLAKKHGLTLRQELIKELPGTPGSGSGFDGGLRLTREWIETGTQFTALLAFDDLTAYGAIRALSEAGRKVPEQCSVIGFDDIPAASFSTPALTTVRQPMGEMGEHAAEVVLRLLERSEEERPSMREGVLMAPALAMRGSTAKAKGSGRKPG